jgi:hypothetical protein
MGSQDFRCFVESIRDGWFHNMRTYYVVNMEKEKLDIYFLLKVKSTHFQNITEVVKCKLPQN